MVASFSIAQSVSPRLCFRTDRNSGRKLIGSRCLGALDHKRHHDIPCSYQAGRHRTGPFSTRTCIILRLAKFKKAVDRT